MSEPRDLEGKVALVTGANTGIGRVTAETLAARGARVLLACRSEARARPVVESIARAEGEERVAFVPLDLSSLSSVREAAERVTSRDEPLHLLINNAGLAGTRGLSADGFELTFAVNHLGHFLLTELLRDKLVASAPARVVNVASRAHARTDGIDFEAVTEPTRSLTGWPEYQQSKLANVLFSHELGRRLEGSGVLSCSLHPGVVASDVWRRIPRPFRDLVKLFMLTEEEGAQTTIHCATAPAVENGGYYAACEKTRPSRVAEDRALAGELWERSEAWRGAS